MPGSDRLDFFKRKCLIFCLFFHEAMCYRYLQELPGKPIPMSIHNIQVCFCGDLTNCSLETPKSVIGKRC